MCFCQPMKINSIEKKTANAIHCRIYVSDKIYQQLRGLVVINWSEKKTQIKSIFNYF